jgi:hypothetical protein
MILLGSTLLTGCGITRRLFRSVSMVQAAGRVLSIGAIVRCFSFPSSLCVESMRCLATKVKCYLGLHLSTDGGVISS